MKAKELKELLDKLSPKELEYDIIVLDVFCAYNSDMVSAKVCETDLGNGYAPENWQGELLQTPEQFAKDYPGEKYYVWAHPGQIIISV